MSFWSDSKISQHGGQLFDPYDPENIDYSGYKLSVGSEVFVTGISTKKSKSSYLLDENETIRIPPGQFALIQTEEKVTMPKDAMGFISMSSRKKLSGLINVSGFHVDPGYKGKLVFSAFNAGPNDIFIDRKERIFSIWIAELSGTHTKSYPLGNVNDSIDSNRVSVLNISDENKSLPYVAEQVAKLKSGQKTVWGISIPFGIGLLLSFLQITFTASSRVGEIEGTVNQLKNEIRTQEVEITQPITIVPSQQAFEDIEDSLTSIVTQQEAINSRSILNEDAISGLRSIQEQISSSDRQLTELRELIENNLLEREDSQNQSSVRPQPTLQ